eukprot:6277844-Alexandrium_andersonii.AAC.1
MTPPREFRSESQFPFRVREKGPEIQSALKLPPPRYPLQGGFATLGKMLLGTSPPAPPSPGGPKVG